MAGSLDPQSRQLRKRFLGHADFALDACRVSWQMLDITLGLANSRIVPQMLDVLLACLHIYIFS